MTGAGHFLRGVGHVGVVFHDQLKSDCRAFPLVQILYCFVMPIKSKVNSLMKGPAWHSLLWFYAAAMLVEVCSGGKDFPVLPWDDKAATFIPKYHSPRQKNDFTFYSLLPKDTPKLTPDTWNALTGAWILSRRQEPLCSPRLHQACTTGEPVKAWLIKNVF